MDKITVGDYIAISPKSNLTVVEYGTVTKMDDEWLSFDHEQGWKCRRKLNKYTIRVITATQRTANFERRLREIEGTLKRRGWM